MDVGSSSLTLAQVQQAAQDAAAAAVPPFASGVPSPEMTGGAAGSVAAVPRADHAHPRLTAINGTITLLSNLISATNAVFQVLSGYVPYEAAGGAQFTLIALQPTTAS